MTTDYKIKGRNSLVDVNIKLNCNIIYKTHDTQKVQISQKQDGHNIHIHVTINVV